MPTSVTIALAGDVMLGRLVDGAITARGAAYPWGDLRTVLEEADLVLVNLECALTAETEEWTDGARRKAFYFRTDPTSGIACLAAGRVGFASLANNHAGDFGTAGLLDTLQTLDRAGIAHAGAGTDLARARAPAVLEAAGVRVAVAAFADHPAEWAATAVSPGINYLPISTAPPVMAVVEETLAAARTAADVVVCSIHWGPNMRARPTPAFRAFARRVFEAGADVLFGHSAHVVQGIEIWQGKPVLYDTGDFVDDYAVDPALRNDLSALFLLRVTPPSIRRIDLLPVRIDRCQVNRARGRERDWFARRIAGLCAELGTRVQDRGDFLEIQVAGDGVAEGDTGP